jgi:galactose mutarotase-like enzyme
MSDRYRIEADGLSATVQAAGAELVSLRDAGGREWLWQAGPEWRRHAPVLFPIVGKLAGDRLRHAGRDYPLTQHGFARDRRFEWVDQAEDRCRLRLCDDADTREGFPFGFVLELDYLLAGGALSVTTRITNPDDAPLPCCVGAHPAFRWPLVEGIAKTDHALDFAQAETGASHRLTGGLLGPAEPLPFDGRHLPLSPALFERDALILPRVNSRSVRFSAPGVPGLTMSWQGYGDLGLWSKPEGADFLCIEPWHGMASPAGWDGEFTEKPGAMILQPGESRDFVWEVRLEA